MRIKVSKNSASVQKQNLKKENNSWSQIVLDLKLTVSSCSQKKNPVILMQHLAIINIPKKLVLQLIG